MGQEDSISGLARVRIERLTSRQETGVAPLAEDERGQVDRMAREDRGAREDRIAHEDPVAYEAPAAQAAPIADEDSVVVEEPLQIRLDGEPLAVTMRTPGHDLELAAGFVFTESVIDAADEIASVAHCRDIFESDHPENAVDVRLRQGAPRERLARAERDFRAVASCGVCGKKTIESLRQAIPEIAPYAPPLDLVRTLPERMRPHQALFAETGGLHAAALFNPGGELLALYEDIGRHNAVDKVIGHQLLHDNGLLRHGGPMPACVLMSSGRAGFEIVQKAARAGIPAVAAVGAASSLAIELAREAGMALYSFVSPSRANRHL